MSVTYADVVVVGAGPGGATTAAWLARAGRDVVLLEKEHFPRDKVCGDGLTPRVVHELLLLGMVEEANGRAPGWAVQRGLRIHGGTTRMELDWPTLDDWPNWGATCSRMVLDEALARLAQKDGAELREGITVTGPIWRDPRSQDRVAGVTFVSDEGEVGEVRAPVVVACDGPSSKLGVAVGLKRRTDRRMAGGARTYFRSPKSTDDHISSYLDLESADGDLLSGYGWIFPLDEGLMNVGLGLLDNSKDFQGTNYRRMLEQWATGLAGEWGTHESAQEGRIRTAPIPMGFNRTPIHHKGLLLVGDSAGMVNPMNGEGISYAMEAGRLAAEIIDDATAARSTAMLDHYDSRLRERWGGYFQLGYAFTEIVGHPQIMRICTTYGMPYRPLMQFVLKMMAHLTDGDPSDTKDVILNSLQNLAPTA